MFILVIFLIFFIVGCCFFVNYDSDITADKAKKEIKRLKENGYKKAYKEAIKKIYSEIKEAVKKQYDFVDIDLSCLKENINQPNEDNYKQFMFDVSNKLEKDGFSVKFIFDYNVFRIHVKW